MQDARPLSRRAALTLAALALTTVACAQPAQNAPTPAALRPAESGYADSNGLRIYYQTYGEGEPIVLLHGGLMTIEAMAPVIAPLAADRRVIAVDLHGHGRTELGDRPMRYESMADDVAAVMRHLNVTQADVAGYSLGGNTALRLAIQHPAMVRRLALVSTVYARSGWYPEVIAGMESVNAAAAPMMEGSPPHQAYVNVAPHPDQFPRLLDAIGELEHQDYDWSAEVAALQMPALLVFADHDAISMQHVASFFALFGGGVRDAGWQNPLFSRARLAIIPGYTHYNFTQDATVGRAIAAWLNEPTADAPSAAP